MMNKRKEMRQPKFKMGQEVEFKLLVSNNSVGLKTFIDVVGVIIGVYYDPECGTTGWPFFEYKILPKGATGHIFELEKNIEPIKA